MKEYCPLVFRNLRERFDIDDASFLKSLTKSPKSMGPSAGKSGAKFYLSQDKLYVIKTIESKTWTNFPRHRCNLILLQKEISVFFGYTRGFVGKRENFFKSLEITKK